MEESVVQRKIAKLILIEMSTILQKESRFGLGTMVTVTLARVTKDLELAKIYVSIYPEDNAQSVVDSLNKNNWELRKMLSARIRNNLKKMPNVIFYLDDSLQEAQKIEDLLATLNIPKDEIPAKAEKEEDDI